MNLSRLYNTVRYLKPIQLYTRIYYKTRAVMRSLVGYKPGYAYYKQGKKLSFLASWIEKPVSYKGNNVFEFLNVEMSFNGCWDNNANGDLWRYNMNYMDFLLQPSMTTEEGYAWIERFIEAMPANKIANDPYPISLRGINWIKFVTSHYNELTQQQLRRIDTALYSQYRILARSTEKHLMANHYLENGFSLLYAACYFGDSTLGRQAERIMRSQLEEQVLSDGAHFELSPMYHCVILERLLDCCNIVNGLCSSDFSEFLFAKAKRMLGWLETVVMSDGNIPLLNDSAIGIAPLPQDIFSYAAALGLEWSAIPLGDSGYRRFKGGAYEAFVDVAALGPSYNLGHSHADTFSFVMNVAGKPFIVDTGVSTYSAGRRRDYERSTLAHNTVCVSGVNSSDVWGAFRCAKRAVVTIIKDEKNLLCAQHNGYDSINVTVKRTFVCSSCQFEIIDEISGDRKDVASTFLLSPDVKIISCESGQIITSLGIIRLNGAVSIDVEPAEVSVSYNCLRPTKRISVSFKDRLSVVFVINQSN